MFENITICYGIWTWLNFFLQLAVCRVPYLSLHAATILHLEIIA